MCIKRWQLNRIWISLIIFFPILILAGIWVFRWRIGYFLIGLFRPRSQPRSPAAGLDYRKPASWHLHPRKSRSRKYIPVNGHKRRKSRSPALFFIHPTSHFSLRHWNQPLPGRRDLLLEQVLLPGQINLFRGAFDLYVPRYPQANFASFSMPEPLAEKVLGIATAELERAFGQFLEEIGERPFILAGHSQGAFHAIALLDRQIAGTPLQKRLIAVYTPGYFIPEATFAEIGIPLCSGSMETGCVQIWNTVSADHRLPPGINNMPQPAGPRPQQRGTVRFACTNPLDPERQTVPAAANQGADISTPFSRRQTLRPGLIGARVQDGKLIIDTPPIPRLRQAQMAPGWYHRHDFGFFSANLRADALRRTDSWFRQQEQGEPAN